MTKLARTSASGFVPDYGTIFMANRYTRRECFTRKIFGAPAPERTFVEKIRAGMVLFLFEYETRKLFGVFEATTDGGWNIVPEAYQKVGSYPSQVCFRVLWRCKPLTEQEFRGAIEDNYYERYKFNFDLSKDQVQKLLSLFYSKKITISKSLTPKEGKRKRSNAMDVESCRLFGHKPDLKEREIENSVSEKTPSNSVNASADSSFSTTLLLALNKREHGNDDVAETTSSNLEDYIPLPSPERDDVVENELVFSEAETWKDNDEANNGHEDLSISEECIVPKIFRQKDLNEVPLSDDCNRSSVPKMENRLIVKALKGLYADNYEEKKCVFSRLKAVVSPPSVKKIKKDLQSTDGDEKKCVFTLLKSVVTLPAVKKIKEDLQSIDGDEKECVVTRLKNVVAPVVKKTKDDFQSPDGLMKKLVDSRDRKWKKFTRTNEQQKEDRSMRNRGSVFSRLNLGPKKATEKKWVKPNNRVPVTIHKKKKERKSVLQDSKG